MTRIRFARLFCSWQAKALTQDLGLGATVDVNALEEPWLASPEVLDGIGSLGLLGKAQIETGGARPREGAALRVLAVSLPNADQARIFRASVALEANVRRNDAIPETQTQLIRIKRFETDIQVRTLPILGNLGRIGRGSADFFVPETIATDATPKIRVLPHVRRSLNLQTISPALRESFLREAEAMNDVAPGQGELLAVFRNVPLAMVSRLRFLEKSGIVLYTIASASNPSRTRVHDMGAVLDRAKQVTHLVAHRTRCKMAILS